jgi:hypothetical protein
MYTITLQKVSQFRLETRTLQRGALQWVSPLEPEVSG